MFTKPLIFYCELIVFECNSPFSVFLFLAVYFFYSAFFIYSLKCFIFQKFNNLMNGHVIIIYKIFMERMIYRCTVGYLWGKDNLKRIWVLKSKGMLRNCRVISEIVTSKWLLKNLSWTFKWHLIDVRMTSLVKKKLYQTMFSMLFIYRP